MNKVLIATLLLFSIVSHADENLQRDRELLLEHSKGSQVDTKKLNRYPEIHQFSDSILQELNSSTGIYNDAYYTRKDSSRFSLAYGFSHDYEQFSKVQSFDFTYLNQFDDSFQELWWAFEIKQTTAKYNSIADERVSTTNDPNSVAAKQRDENTQSLTTFGIGISHRFKTLSSVFNTERLFETISVFANYNLHTDSTDSEKYAGVGYNADYTLGYRSSHGLYYGGKVSYNWALVGRTQVDNESLNDRTLVFGWTSIGIECGYFF